MVLCRHSLPPAVGCRLRHLHTDSKIVGTRFVTENVSTDTRPAVIHYENVPLEQILSDIAKYNKVELRFLNERSRRFRLYYDWHQEEPVDDIARMLNTFESIHIEFRQNTLYVE